MNGRIRAGWSGAVEQDGLGGERGETGRMPSRGGGGNLSGVHGDSSSTRRGESGVLRVVFPDESASCLTAGCCPILYHSMKRRLSSR
jgi:hypothetical protein